MRKLDFTRKLLLTVAGVLALVAPIVFGQATTPQIQAESQAENPALIAPVYEVASIKPDKPGAHWQFRGRLDGFSATRIPLQMLISMAYHVKDDQISGAPKWLNSETYDFDAKMDSSVADALKKLSPEQRGLVSGHMLQALLEDRLQLKVHRETKELPVYWLVVAKPGKLHEHEGDCVPLPDSPPPMPERGKLPTPPCGGFTGSSRNLVGQKVPVKQIAYSLSQLTDRVVLDKTGLTAKYDINLNWTPEEGEFPGRPEGAPNGLPAPPKLDTNGPSLFTAIQEQLGLKLQPGKGPVEIIVIDHVERPSPN